MLSSTRNATFQKRALASACFVYAKRYFQKTGRSSSTRNISFFGKLRSRLRKTLFFRVKQDGAEPPGALGKLAGGSQTAWAGDRPKLTFFFAHPLRQNRIKILTQNSGLARWAH